MAEDLNAIGHHPNPPTWASSTPNFTTSPGAPTVDGQSVNDVNLNLATGRLYSWNGASWDLLPGGGGSGDPEVFHIAGSGTPSTGPVGDAGYAYNDVGNAWVWLTNATWGQIA